MLVLLFAPGRAMRETDPVAALAGELAPLGLRGAPERTLGDEAIAVADRADVAVQALCRARELDAWRIGMGIGAAAYPPGSDPRSAHGPALDAARTALRAASTTSQVPLAVRAADDRHTDTAARAEAVLRLIAWMIATRSPGQWRVVRELRENPQLPQRELAARLGVTQQTVSRALATSGWREERAAHPVLADLLAMIDLTSQR